MGSVVQYHCTACGFETESLRIGWGKAGRSVFWGGLARCEPCQQIGVADLAVNRRERGNDPRCGRCNAPLTLIEGMAVSVSCPSCRNALDYKTVGSWN